MLFSVPVALSYGNKQVMTAMGPFERSLERDFSLALNKKALEECNDISTLKEVAMNLLEGWSNMQEAVGTLVKENLELRQAMKLQNQDLEAADELLKEACDLLKDNGERMQSSPKRWRLWPFGK